MKSQEKEAGLASPQPSPPTWATRSCQGHRRREVMGALCHRMFVAHGKHAVVVPLVASLRSQEVSTAHAARTTAVNQEHVRPASQRRLSASPVRSLWERLYAKRWDQQELLQQSVRPQPSWRTRLWRQRLRLAQNARYPR